MNDRPVNITIDGPSGAGKSTMARKLAEALGFLYVDTGALYRAVGLAVYRAGRDPSDEDAVSALLPELRVTLTMMDGAQRVLLDGEDVSETIRLPEMSAYSSQVSALPAVRAFLLETQREIARRESVVMDGRDIGTVVLPDARVKIFLHAELEERAHRRFLELQANGVSDSYETVLEDMRRRDERDTNRAVAPLRRAADAEDLDSTHMTREQTQEALEALVKRKLGYAV